MTLTDVRTGTALVHFTFSEETLQLSPSGLVELATSLKSILTVGTATVIFPPGMDPAFTGGALTRAQEETAGFRVKHVSYSSPFHIVFASVTATCTTAAFAIAALYARVLSLKTEHAKSLVRLEVYRHLIRELRFRPDGEVARQLQEYELTRFGRDDLPQLAQDIERAAGILEAAEDIRVEEGN